MLPVALTLAMQAHAQDHGQQSHGQQVERYALLIGHNDGGVGRTVLRYAHDDAEEMADVLVELGGVSADKEILLLDPDLAALEAALDKVRVSLNAAGGEAEFLFYYSGHSDEESLLLGDERYGYRELRAMLDALPARVRLAILDSCSSGALILAKGGSRTAPFLIDQSIRVDGFAYMTSSSADEVAQEAERIGGSYFTHYLASGLRGAADISGDGRVTLNEAYSFANQETLLRTERTQHGPQHASHETHLSGTGDLVLTDLGMTSATLVLDESLDGRTMVRDFDGNLIVELQKLPGRPIELGLAEGRYSVTLLRGDEQYGDVTVELELGSSMPVSASDLVWHDSELAVARGGPIVPPASTVQNPKPLKRWPRMALAGFDKPPVQGDSLIAAAFHGRSTDLDGFAISLGGYHVQEKVTGAETAIAFTSAGELDGMQASVGGNWLEAGGEGIQLSAGGNYAGKGFDGGQLSVGINVAGGGIRGTQLSSGVNLAPGGFDGLQATAGLNVAGRISEGVQLSSGLNIADAFSGAQLGIVNIGGDVNGLQFGVINIGRNVKGSQIGVINVANDVKGAPIGLFSFEKEGRHDLLLFASESDVANLELKLGGDYVYTVVGTGITPAHGYVSFGLGAHAPFGKVVWADVDVVGAAYVGLGTTTVGNNGADGPFSHPPTPVVRPRVTIGFQLAKQIAPFVGASLNVRIPTDYPSVQVAPEVLTLPEVGNPIVWPGAFAGVQF